MNPRRDFRRWPDVASRALGASVVWTNDDSFADVHTLITASPPVHDPLLFGPRGKVYDGWETRRRRMRGDDEVIVRLAAPTVVHGADIDTSFFRGNYPPHASLQVTALLGYPSAVQLRAAHWQTVIDRAELEGDAHNVIEVDGDPQLATHVRLVIHPDGGIARLRVHGEVVPDPAGLGSRVDLAATTHGGRVTACSNLFYSSPANVLAPGVATVMSDGWETARRRDDGNDWIVVALVASGVLHDVVIDTSRFVGNAPGWARLTDEDTGLELLPRTALVADTEQRFRITHDQPVSTVRLDVYPDGGISRLRVHGSVDEAERPAMAKRWLDLLPPAVAALVDPDEFFR